MNDQEIRHERAANLWNSQARKYPALASSTELLPAPSITSDDIGGLEGAQEEVLTYACVMTSPEVYEHWGTHPPTGLMLIGEAGCGKRLLAEALATRANTGFLVVAVPRLALEIIRHGGKVGDLLDAWTTVLSEMPPTTVLFQELEFFQTEEMGGRRTDLPVGPIMDFLVEITDRTVAAEETLVVGSTSHPDTLRPAFVMPGRFERVVEVTPAYPEDIVAALQIHARKAETRAGRALFGKVDWSDVVSRFRDPGTGDWIHLLHSVLRRKARCESTIESVPLVTTDDLLHEVELYRRTRKRLPRPAPAGTYL